MMALPDQLDHVQTISTSLQTDNHINNPSLNFFTRWMLFPTPSQQCQSTEGTMSALHIRTIYFHY